MEEEIVFPLTDVQLSELLGVKLGTIRSRKSVLKGNLNEGEHYREVDNPQHRSSKDFKIFLWEEPGAIEVAQKLRTEKARFFLKNRGITLIKGARVEYTFVDIIETALYSIAKCKRQYRVEVSGIPGSFKVDLFLPEYGIVIECDESHHESNSNQIKDMIRQEVIGSDKGYTFIRFSPEEKNFDFGKVLNQIFKKIMGNLRPQ